MTQVISIAYAITLLSGLFVILWWGRVRCVGTMPVTIFVLVALLFTAGLDMGLVMLPLTEFPIYADDPAYDFSNPLAVEFGMWGPLVWLMYFLSTFYFVKLEPKLQVFEIPLVKWVYNLTVIATAAFTCYLFMSALPSYVPGIPDLTRWVLTVAVIGSAVYSSSNVNFMKWLAVTSTWMFVGLTLVMLIAAAYVFSGAGLSGLFANVLSLLDYFPNILHFTTPITEYHEFYLFWWFAWSIMIGQFVATFVSGLHAWRLAGAMIFLPAIPLGIWFCVIYIYFQRDITIPTWLNMAMVAVGIVFVVNSLDSLMRLYSSNLDIDIERLGRKVYFPLHFTIQIALVMAYQFTPFRIEWVGVIVILLYGAVYVVIYRQKHEIGSHVRAVPEPALPEEEPGRVN